MIGARPEIELCLAMSADGKIASATREPGRLASAADLARLFALRAAADAVLVGAQTVRESDPPLGLPPAEREARLLAGSRQPLQLVLSGSARLPPRARALREPGSATRILATSDTAEVDEALAGDGVEIWRLGAPLRLERLLEQLVQRGVARLLVEGGGRTAWAFAERGWVDALHLTIAPLLLGGHAAPTPLDGQGFSLSAALRLELIDTLVDEGEIYCHYRVGTDDAGAPRRKR